MFFSVDFGILGVLYVKVLFMQVRASSVRASIESTLRDLKAGVESAGVEVSISGQKSTDGMISKFYDIANGFIWNNLSIHGLH